MSRYKVLKTPKLFDNNLWAYTHIIEEGDEPISDEEAIPLVIDELTEEGFKQTVPVFHRDGWYYDRIEKKCWYEWRGIAWIAEYTAFEHELSQLEDRMLEQAEIQAIKTLILYGSCPKKLIQLLWKNEQKVMLRRIYRESRMARISILK